MSGGWQIWVFWLIVAVGAALILSLILVPPSDDD